MHQRRARFPGGQGLIFLQTWLVRPASVIRLVSRVLVELQGRLAWEPHAFHYTGFSASCSSPMSVNLGLGCRALVAHWPGMLKTSGFGLQHHRNQTLTEFNWFFVFVFFFLAG